MPVTPETVGQSDLSLYVEYTNSVPPEVRESQFRATMKVLNRFRPLPKGSRILEIGIGVGWFQVNGLRSGLACEGLDLSPQCVDCTRELARRYGVEAQVRLGNIETADIGSGLYDAIFSDSLLEHVPGWREALAKIHAALKPGGIFYFSTSNKFAFFSGEFRRLPLYGWLPYRLRRWIRTAVEGPEVMLWCMDVNQFRHSCLKKALEQTGFGEVLDYVETLDPNDLNHPTLFRRLAAKTLKSSRLAKRVALAFWPANTFLCRK